MNKKNNKLDNNIERILLVVSIVLLVIMLILTVYNFIFFPALINVFAIMLFIICSIMKKDKDKDMEIYVGIIFGVGLALIIFSTIYTIISLLI